MGLSMYKLDFDPASPSESDRIGSFLIGSGGTVIAETGTSLNVNVTNTVTVSATNLDIRDLTHASDSVKVGDGTDFLEIYAEDAASAGGEKGLVMLGIRQDAAGSPVSADGDFHPFVFNNDGELKVAADLTSSVADDDANSGNPILVGSVAYAATLSALSATGDRGNLASDVYRRVHVNDSANIACLGTQTGVTNSAALVVASSLAGRKKMTIQNISSTDIYIGGSGVTTSSGLLIKKGDSYTESIGAGCAVYAIAGSAGPHNVRVLEVA